MGGVESLYKSDADEELNESASIGTDVDSRPPVDTQGVDPHYAQALPPS